MSKSEINSKLLTDNAIAAGDSIAREIFEVHGSLWKSREELSKLVISLSSAFLVGTISFSSSIVGQGTNLASCTEVLVYSWVALFITICAGIFSLWHSNTLHSFHARFTNSQPNIEQEISELNAEEPVEEIMKKAMIIVKKYSDVSLEPLGKADK